MVWSCDLSSCCCRSLTRYAHASTCVKLLPWWRRTCKAATTSADVSCCCNSCNNSKLAHAATYACKSACYSCTLMSVCNAYCCCCCCCANLCRHSKQKFLFSKSLTLYPVRLTAHLIESNTWQHFGFKVVFINPMLAYQGQALAGTDNCPCHMQRAKGQCGSCAGLVGASPMAKCAQ